MLSYASVNCQGDNEKKLINCSINLLYNVQKMLDNDHSILYNYIEHYLIIINI